MTLNKGVCRGSCNDCNRNYTGENSFMKRGHNTSLGQSWASPSPTLGKVSSTHFVLHYGAKSQRARNRKLKLNFVTRSQKSVSLPKDSHATDQFLTACSPFCTSILTHSFRFGCVASLEMTSA